jgi:hypothetical protein
MIGEPFPLGDGHKLLSTCWLEIYRYLMGTVGGKVKRLKRLMVVTPEGPTSLFTHDPDRSGLPEQVLQNINITKR